MKVSLQIVSFNWEGTPENTGSRLADIAGTADDLGFASIWVMDHFFQMDMPQMGLKPEEPMMDGYTVLSYLAAVTKNVRLGTLVTGANYRHPGHLIKIVSNLDVLSGGRANLGIGAGWYEREALGLGFPFPPLKERFERLEETLQIAKQMWSGDVKPYNGQHYQLAEPMNNPMPLSNPHPPILIGGAGEKKTLRMVAQYADACNLFAFLGSEELSRKLDILKEHCDTVGRPYEEIERTALDTVNLGEGGQSSDELVDRCRSLAKAGIQHIFFNMPNNYSVEHVEKLGQEIIPAVADF